MAKSWYHLAPKYHLLNKEPYVSTNYKGKNPMTRTQWRRYQRKKKEPRETQQSSNNKPYQVRIVKQPRGLVGQKLFSSKHAKTKGK